MPQVGLSRAINAVVVQPCWVAPLRGLLHLATAPTNRRSCASPTRISVDSPRHNRWGIEMPVSMQTLVEIAAAESVFQARPIATGSTTTQSG
jgi:hypothetical protein